VSGVRAGVLAGGHRFRISGYGDSPVRFARHLASKLRTFTISPARFTEVRETALRAMKSFDQTEAYALARERRDAFSREFYFLPNELMPRATAATWPDVQAFAQKLLARGKLEAVVHGHITPEDAVAVTRDFAAGIGASAAPDNALLRRRHLEIAAAENVVDTGEIAGVNSAFIRDYVLPDDGPLTRAASAVVANFISTPFYSELRTKQQLGYIVGSSASGSLRQRYFTFIVQSSTHAADEVRDRAEAVIATLARGAGRDRRREVERAGGRRARAPRGKAEDDRREGGQFLRAGFHL
jgi:insulysin